MKKDIEKDALMHRIGYILPEGFQVMALATRPCSNSPT
jgi:hypothetical protein